MRAGSVVYCMADCAAEDCYRNLENIPPDNTAVLPMEDFSPGCPHYVSHQDAGTPGAMFEDRRTEIEED